MDLAVAFPSPWSYFKRIIAGRKDTERFNFGNNTVISVVGSDWVGKLKIDIAESVFDISLCAVKNHYPIPLGHEGISFPYKK